jgi:hypothetical protein
MDEQSPHESQPKVRRAENHSAEEPQPSVTRAGGTGQAEQENVSKGSQAGEETSQVTDEDLRQLESVLPSPFQTTQHALDKWTHFFGRVVERNSRAVGDLSACPSVANVLRWQIDLVQSNVEDWLETSSAVFDASVRKVSHAKAASETATT